MPASSIDLLGYIYMSLSTWLLAPVFPGGGPTRWLRRTLIANGVLAPVILGRPLWPALIYVASPWLVAFPASMVLLAREFAGPREPQA